LTEKSQAITLFGFPFLLTASQDASTEGKYHFFIQVFLCRQSSDLSASDFVPHCQPFWTFGTFSALMLLFRRQEGQLDRIVETPSPMISKSSLLGTQPNVD